MHFTDYKASFEARRAKLRFPPGTTHEGVGCQTRVNPNLPPWVMDWAILYPDGKHIRVKETYKAKPHPLYNQGERMHFSFQYGETTGRDAKGMPRTMSDRDTVIRLDSDQFGPHLHYEGRAHVKQEDVIGKLIIDQAEVFDFIDAVETCRQSGCSMGDVLLFSLRKADSR